MIGYRLRSLMQKGLETAASLFRLRLPITFSLAESAETISSTQEGHLVYAGNVDKENLYETLARAKLYEECGEDLVNLSFVQVDAKNFEQATTIFSNLTMPILSCWTFDLMHAYLREEQFADEVDYLKVLYGRICALDQPTQHQPVLGAVCFATLKHIGENRGDLCDALEQMTPVVDMTLINAKKSPSLQTMIDCFNELDGPFRAEKEGKKIHLIPTDHR